MKPVEFPLVSFHRSLGGEMTTRFSCGFGHRFLVKLNKSKRRIPERALGQERERSIRADFDFYFPASSCN